MHEIDKQGLTKFRPLSKRVLIAIVFASTLITSIMTVLNLYFDFKTELSTLDETFITIEKGSLTTLALSIWNFNEDQVRAQLDGIIRLNDIVSAKALDDKGDVIVEVERSEHTDHRYDVTRTFVLKYPAKDSSEENIAGSVVVTATKQSMFQRLLMKVLIFFVTQTIKTIIISSIILLIIKYYITDNLKIINHFFKQYNISDSTNAALIHLPSRGRYYDDFELLVAPINKMISDLAIFHKFQENKIFERTINVILILQNIRQGIFSITDKLTIHSEYSNHLEEILETEDIAERNITDLLLRPSTLTKDEIEIIESTLNNMLGEDFMSYQVNSHHFPKEIFFKNKFLELQVGTYRR